MITAEEMANQIRHRQHELAALTADKRQEMLAAELRHVCDGLPASQRKLLLSELERLFPTGLDEDNVSIPKPTVETHKPTWEEMVSALNQEMASMPESARSAFRRQLAQVFGFETAHPAAPSGPTGELSAAFQVFKEAMLCAPDPIMNDPIEPLSIVDIKDLQSLATKLNHQADPISRFLWQGLSPEVQSLVSKLAVSQGRTSKELDQCGAALVEDLSALMSRGSIYEEQRFARVKLSQESRRLLKKYQQGLAPVRLNKSLLEDAYPEEILCQTTEREFVEGTIASLLKCGERPISTEAALHLAAVSLIELGCLEQFARVILLNLNKRVFDPVFGRLRIEDLHDMGSFLAQFMKEADAGALVGNLRYFTGLIKCLLESYQLFPVSTASALIDLDPERIEKRRTRPGGAFTGPSVAYEEAWEDYKKVYRSVRRKLCGAAVDNAGNLNEETFKELIKITIERKVTARVYEKYGWNLRDDN